MRIGIIAYHLSVDKITGVERYLRSLIVALSKIDKTNRYFLYSWQKPHEFQELGANFKLRIAPYQDRWNQKVLPRLIMQDNLDVLFSPGSILPKLPDFKGKIVYHFHDMAFKLFPSAYSLKSKLLNHLSVKRAKLLADKVIVSSKASKVDLVKYYKFSASKISVIPFGFKTFANAKDSLIHKRCGILYVGRIEAKKNLINLLKSYKTYAETVTNPDPLYLVGMPGYKFEPIEKLYLKLKQQGLPIKLLNYVSDTELKQLFTQSRVFFFPSHYEGFGLPILEAFSADLPVITSNTSSMPEVAGRGAIYVDPNNLSEMEKQLIRLMNDSKLQQELVKKGRLELAKYSWEKTAEETLNIFTHA